MSRAHELAQTATEQMVHVARGCRSGFSHNPAPYEKAHDIAVTELERLAADAERYREALEQVYQVGRGPHVGIAREALNDFETGGTGAILDGSVAGAAEEDDT